MQTKICAKDHHASTLCEPDQTVEGWKSHPTVATPRVTASNVVEISLDLQVLVHVCPAHAPSLDHPALDRPRVVGPAVHTVFAHLFQAERTQKKIRTNRA